MKQLQKIPKQYYANIESDGSQRNLLLRKHIDILDKIIDGQYPNEEITKNALEQQVEKIKKMGIHQLSDYRNKISLSTLPMAQKQFLYSEIEKIENKKHLEPALAIHNTDGSFDE